MTLGGQYDWTEKSYPSGEAPEFPSDIARLTAGFFPEMRPEAAIVNVYTPGDTLSIHRDISEDSENGLVSISLGCDGIFVAGLSDKLANSTKQIVVRLRSGDVVYMSGQSRFSWHGIPKILADTCPPWLSDWPATSLCMQGNDVFEAWRGWMSTKRVNLNIRQMKA